MKNYFCSLRQNGLNLRNGINSVLNSKQKSVNKRKKNRTRRSTNDARERTYFIDEIHRFPHKCEKIIMVKLPVPLKKL
mgnify:CR=1 FL=1